MSDKEIRLMELKMLKDLFIPNDKYISIIREPLLTEIEKCKWSFGTPFRKCITLELLKNTLVRRAADVYMKDLIKHDSVLGIFYHANKQCLLVSLKLEFRAGDAIVDKDNTNDIFDEIDILAEMYSKPWDLNFEITKIELLYFFALLINPHLNWVTVDFLLGCNKSHAYFVVSPHRITPHTYIDTKSIIFQNAMIFANNFRP